MATKRWICPNCKIVCAIEIQRSSENIVWCVCNNSRGNCNYSETVSETKKRLKKLGLIKKG